MDVLGSERFIRNPSLQLLSDIEAKDDDEEEVGKAIEEDYCSPDLNEKEIISCRLNEEAQDKIDQLTGIFRSCVKNTINGETEDLHDGTPRLAKGLKLEITMTIVHQYSSMPSSYSSSHGPSSEGITVNVVQQHSSTSSNSSSHRSCCEGRKSLILEPTNSPFESSGKTVSSKEVGHDESKLPLPPRLREATYRNPLCLSHVRKDWTELPPPSTLEQLFSPKESPGRSSVQSPLSKMVKKQKEISVKLWRSSLHLIHKHGKLEFPRNTCWSLAAHGEPNCRSVEWVQSVQLKLRSKWVKIMQCQRKISASLKGLKG